MYCRKCGKKIDYDAEICVECQENEELFTRTDESASDFAPKYECPVQQPCASDDADNGSRMYGFGLALAAVIVAQFALGFISGIFPEIGESGWLTAVVLLPLPIGMSVFTLIAGIGSIKKFVACSKQGKVKPIPTLVLGIAAVVLSGLNFLLLSFIPMMFLIIT